ncbi:MAG: MtnX-like HAD-IB family phosphatase [Thermoplasmata archaeon]|nr:MtnX-like HAD-IB family phosphatase [Thermoplasmata archaeon]
MSFHPPFTMLIDFDGTLVDPNVAIVLVEKFCPNGDVVAHEVDIQLHEGKITLREAWEREASLMRADQIPEMVDFVVKNVPLREGARDLLDLLAAENIPTKIVSGGLDFYIHPVLEREGLRLPVLSDAAIAGPDGQLRVLHPHGHATCRLCGICKAQAVRAESTDPGRVVFVGDGSTDQYAAEVADVVFARRRLLSYCQKMGIPAFPFEGFGPVTAQVRGWIRGNVPFPERRRLGLGASPCPISSGLAVADA